MKGFKSLLSLYRKLYRICISKLMHSKYFRRGGVQQLAVAILALFILLINQFSAQAGLSVDPVVSDIIVSPGKESVQIFKLKNTGESTMQIRIEAEPMVKGDDVSKWLIIKQGEFKLEPGAEYNFSCVISPSESAGSELRARLFFIADELDEKGNFKSMIGMRFGVSVYAVILERAVFNTEIKSCEFIYELGKHLLKGKIEVDNKSNVHIRPVVEVTIFDNTGKEVSKFKAPYGQAVQKEKVSYLSVQENMELADGKYKALINLDYGMLYGVKEKIASKEIEFVVENKIVSEEKQNEEIAK